jgi:succinoglycan biosynthesis transport protein ExoP
MATPDRPGRPDRTKLREEEEAMLLNRSDFAEAPQHAPSDVHFINIDALLAMVRRQLKVLLLCLGIGIALGAFYLVMAPRAYFASAMVLIDPNLQDVVNQVQQQSPVMQQTDLEDDVLNQMEVVKSGRIARAVVVAEKLNTDPEFLNPPASFTQRVAGPLLRLFGQGSASPGPLTSLSVDDTARLLARDVHVERVGRSSVISVGYEASSPQLARRIASAYADAFEQDQLNADLEANRNAADWLQQRLSELAENQRQASLAVEQYRQQHNLSIASSDTLSAQRLQGLTAQLVTAQSDLARDQSLSAQLAAAVAAGPEAAGQNIGLLTAAAVPNVTNPDVSNITENYASTSRRLAEVTANFGPDHPQVQALKHEQQGIADQIYSMLKDLNGRYLNIVATDRGREAALRSNVENEGAAPPTTDEDQVRLSELQRHATALQALYDSYLSRYEETVQRQSFPIPTVRIITPPALPLMPSSPRIVLVAAGSILFGLCLGACFGGLNELRERSFRLGQQVNDETALRFIGYLPRIATKGSERDLPHRVYQAVRHQIAQLRPNSPATAFIETLRAAALLLQDRTRGQAVVVGTASVLPGEGKTIFALSLAGMLAASGRRTLLIDADLRAPEASRLTAPDATHGLLDIAGGKPWQELLQRDDEFGLNVLPLAPSDKAVRGDFLSSPRMVKLLNECRTQFDYVIIDLPPLGPVVDALAMLPMTDGLFLIAEWGKTPRRLVRALLDREPRLADRMIGVVLNKVDFRKLPRYSAPGDAERYFGVYQHYYRAKLAEKAAS